MSWIRTGVLVSLTLVAATLPSTARSARGVDVPATAKGQVPGSTADRDHGTPGRHPTAPARNDSGPLLQSAPSPDVWKSASARPLNGAGAPTGAGVFCHVPAEGGSCLLPGRLPQIQGHPLPVDAQAWMSCRYPNAPPAV